MTQLLLPATDISVAAGWSLVGAATYSEAMQSLDDATSYGQTTTPGAVLEMALDVAGDPGTNSDHLFEIRMFQNGASAAPVILGVKLVQGSTVLWTTTFTHLRTAFWITYSAAIPSPVAAAISDYGDLRVRLYDVQSTGAVQHRVTWVRVSVPDSAGLVRTDLMAIQAGAARPEAVEAYGSDTEAGAW